MAGPVILRGETGQMVPASGGSAGYHKDRFAALREMAAADKTGDFRRKFNAMKRLEAAESTLPQAPPEPSPWERFGRGAAQLPAGLAQLAPESLGGMSPGEEQAFSEGEQLYRQAVPGFDPWSMGGELAGQAPLAAVPGLGPAGLLSRAAVGAGTEAGIGAAMFADSPQERARNALAGGVGGAVGTAAVPALAGVGKRLTSVVPQRLPALDRARRDAMRRYGYEGTRGQVSRDPLVWGDEMNLAKQEGAENLQGRFAAQRERDLTNVADLQEAYGGPRELAEGGMALEGGVGRRSAEWQGQVRDLYETARAERPALAVPGQRLTDATADVLDDFDVPPAVSRRLSSLAESPDGIVPGDLEKLDKMLSRNMGVNKATDNAMRRLKERVRGVIDEAGEEYGGAYRAAVGEARKRFDAIGDLKSIVNKIERGAIDPIKTIPALRSAGVKELGALRSFVADSDPDAWQAMQGALASDLATRATPGGQFSQAGYNRWLQQVGPERLRILFGEQGAADLREFGGVVRDLYAGPRGNTMNVSNTNMAARRGMDGVLRRILGSVYLGGLYDVVAESGAKRANARQAALALDPTKRPGTMDERGLLAGGSRALGAGLGGVLGGALMQ